MRIVSPSSSSVSVQESAASRATTRNLSRYVVAEYGCRQCEGELRRPAPTVPPLETRQRVATEVEPQGQSEFAAVIGDGHGAAVGRPASGIGLHGNVLRVKS